MIERKGGDKQAPPKKQVKIVEEKPEEKVPDSPSGLSEDVIIANRRKLAEKLSGKKKTADSK